MKLEFRGKAMDNYQNSSVMIIDHSRLLREGLRQIMAGTSFSVLYEFPSLEAALDAPLEGGAPQLILLEWLPRENEDNPVTRLRERLPDARVIAFGDTLSKQQMVQALRAGASGYLLKDMSLDALIQSLRLVLMGEVVFPTELAAHLVTGSFSVDTAAERLGINGFGATLSERELQILKCLINGYPNKIIARQLSITEGTVKVHLKGLLKKIHVQNRTQAAIWALDHGIRHNDGAEA
ncbi:LuxR C-terminal-related transcriptional regulator [Fodinicurvata halophila]|uniref:LuxR C-terminal-related transcriptional regulator n=1 Tax=Fodinicurvata halophila TaxID=1419723 RepID=A0ABV8UL18_9PROT